MTDASVAHPPPRDPSRPVVLMTGPEGLIGSRIIRKIASRYTIVGFDRPPSPSDEPDLDYVQVDLTKPEQITAAFDYLRTHYGNRIASVIHLAAYYDFKGEPSPLYETLTVEGTRHLLRGLQSFEVGQFIFSSSLLVMKPVEPGRLISEESPTEPTWDYPKSKLRAEQVIREERGDIPALSLRIAGVYDADGHSIPIGQQVARIYEKQLESYFFPGDPSHGQAFVHLDDLADCFASAIEHRDEFTGYQELLIAEPDVVTYDELQDLIGTELHGQDWPTIRIPRFVAKAGAWVKEKLATEKNPVFIKPWMIDLADQHMPVDTERSERVLHWHPKHRLRTTLPEILRRLKRDPAAWYRLNEFPVPDHLAAPPERTGAK